MNDIEAAFFANTTLTALDGIRWERKCNRGLWSVVASTPARATREGMHYFRQYYEDGEYDGTALEKLKEHFTNNRQEEA